MSTSKICKVPLRNKPSDEFRKINKKINELGGFVAGGAARYIYTKGDIDYNDIDIFCKNEEAFDKLCDYLCLLERGIRINPSRFARTYHAPVDTDISKGCHSTFSHIPIQVIKTLDNEFTKKHKRVFFGPIEKVIGSFDFTIAQIALDHTGDYAYVSQNFIDDIKYKRLRYNNVPGVDNIQSSSGDKNVEHRIAKYQNKGFRFTKMDLLDSLNSKWLEYDDLRKMVIEIMRMDDGAEVDKKITLKLQKRNVIGHERQRK